MNPTTQTVLHDPANGVIGNCMSAVLASLLHLPIESVPLFADPDCWVKDLNAWLRPYGLAYLSFPAEGLPQLFADFGISGLHHDTAGVSLRFSDAHHACVAKDGELVFDPHPSRAGLGALESCGVFIALEPWKWSKS